MGKTNGTYVEITPVNENDSKTPVQNSVKMPYGFGSDPTLVPRVQKYLENNIDKTYVDINQMADELQEKYKEYGRRKRTAFRAAVKKAYSEVLHSYGLEDKDTSDEEGLLSDDSEQESDGEDKFVQGKNSVNNALTEMYQRQAQSKPKLIDNELIDISSEDSEEEAAYKKSNGAAAQTSLQNHGVIVQQSSTSARAEMPTIDRGKKRKFGEATLLPLKNVGGPRKKIKTKVDQHKFQSRTTFKDIGGINAILEDVCKLLLHIQHPELYRKFGISPPRGFLLHGPPGCGKSLLANAIAGELGVQLIKVAAPELVAGVSGESEERIRELFEKACDASPCVLFIDEIDAITPNRQNAQKEMERRIVAQLLSCLDDISCSEIGEQVLVIGATNRPDAIDPALRRAGRFDREICLGIPDVKAREQIFRVLTAKIPLASDFDYQEIAKYTPGYVGADLLSLTREAAMVAINRVFTELKEKRRLKQELESQKAAEAARKATELAKKRAEELAKKQQEDEAKAVNSIALKDDEIVVDDDVPKDKEVSESSEAVVVLDDPEDQQSKDPDETALVVDATPQDTGKSAEDSEEIVVEVESQCLLAYDTPLQIKPPGSTLDELLDWLHDTSPVNTELLHNLSITREDFAAALKKVQPSAKREGFATVPDTTWEDVGSLKDVREELQMAILGPVRHSEQFEALGLNVPSGVLLCGPPGCGKTLLAKAVANEAGINFISVKGPELLNMYVGESERAVRVCFERARNSAPCVIFFDELDALCPKRSDSREGGATMRVVNQMLTEMDGVEGRKGVFLLAATNRPDIIDPAVLRPGRLDMILYVGLPSREERVDILRAITKNGTRPKLDDDVDLVSIGTSDQTKGYTGADLAAFVRKASVLAMKEFMLNEDTSKPLMVSSRHFAAASEKIRPSVSEQDQKRYDKFRRIYTAVPEEAAVEEMEY